MKISAHKAFQPKCARPYMRAFAQLAVVVLVAGIVAHPAAAQNASSATYGASYGAYSTSSGWSSRPDAPGSALASTAAAAAQRRNASTTFDGGNINQYSRQASRPVAASVVPQSTGTFSRGISAASTAANYAERGLQSGTGMIVTAAGTGVKVAGAGVRTAASILPGSLRWSAEVEGNSNGGGYVVTALPGQVGPGGLCWPVIGQVSRGFNLAIRHKGIDICAPTGTPVYASRTGRVIYADNKLSGFGNLVILEHGHGLATLYAHNSVMLVRVGDIVRQGQVIAQVGQTGDATGPHCHFELRFNSVPVDARPYLP